MSLSCKGSHLRQKTFTFLTAMATPPPPVENPAAPHWKPTKEQLQQLSVMLTEAQLREWKGLAETSSDDDEAPPLLQDTNEGVPGADPQQ